MFKVNTTVSCQVPREIWLTAQEAHRLFKQENDNMGQVARNKTWPLIWFCLSKVTFFGFSHGKSLWKTTIWRILLFTSFRHRKSKAKDFMGEKHHHYITIVVISKICANHVPPINHQLDHSGNLFTPWKFDIEQESPFQGVQFQVPCLVVGAYFFQHTWRIFPVSEWIITMLSNFGKFVPFHKA